MSVLRVLLALIRNILADRAELVTENLALRPQLAILEQKSKRPRFVCRPTGRTISTQSSWCLLN